MNPCSALEAFKIWANLNNDCLIETIEIDNKIIKKFEKDDKKLIAEITYSSYDSVLSLYEIVDDERILYVYSGPDLLEIIEYVDNDIFSIIKEIISHEYTEILSELFYISWWKVFYGDIDIYVGINADEDKYFLLPNIDTMTRINYLDINTNINSFLINKETNTMSIFYI